MKRHLVFILSSLLVATGAGAQTPDWNKVSIDRPAVDTQGEQAVVTFEVSAARRSVKSTEALVFTPVLTDGVYSLSLPAVVVSGGGFRKLEKRHSWLAELPRESILWVKNEETASYRAAVPRQSWMSGAKLLVNTLGLRARAQEEGPVRTLTNGGRPSEDRWGSPTTAVNVPVTIPWERIGQPEPFSTGDLIAERHPFVMPEPVFGEKDSFDIYTSEQESTMIIHFHVGSHTIVPHYRNNEVLLNELTRVIDRLQVAEDCRIERVLLAGFASPEGELDDNERLAYNRAMAIKEHLLRNTSLPYYRILLYNGSVDWRGLRRLVEHSDLREKYDIISIIDAPQPDGDQRIDQLKQMNGGSTYARLFRDFFPQLRNGTLIRIYYKNEAANR